MSTRLAREFNGDHGPAAGALLDAYDGPEVERVQLAILDLSSGRLEHVRHYLERARGDYRDILLWAESEGFGNYLGSPGT